VSKGQASTAKPVTSRGHVLVAEDNAPLRVGLVSALRRAGFSVDGAATGEQATALLTCESFDVLLADINMPGNAKLELLDTVQALGVGVILMTGQPSVDTAVGALQAGAVDYLTKPISPEFLLRRLDAAIVKSRALKGLARNVGTFDAGDLDRLSQREREVLTLLAVGHPPKEIAVRLGLAANTVRNHVKAIFLKLRVHSQVELLVKLGRRTEPDAG
jgi:DNA-binding NarL/FixJ family response regulator